MGGAAGDGSAERWTRNSRDQRTLPGSVPNIGRQPRKFAEDSDRVPTTRGRGGEIRTPGLLLPKPSACSSSGSTSTYSSRMSPLEPENDTGTANSGVNPVSGQAALGSRSWAVSAMSMPRVAAMSQMRARLAERYSVDS